MREDEIYRTLTPIFHDTFDDDTIVLTAATSAADVKGWDSLRMVMLVVAVEARFGIKTRTREIDQLQCVGDFVRLIATKVA